jgi:hypothetical protein
MNWVFISQNTKFFIATAVKILNLTYYADRFRRSGVLKGNTYKHTKSKPVGLHGLLQGSCFFTFTSESTVLSASVATRSQ